MELLARAKALAQELCRRHPALITAEYRVAKRPPGRVLVDYNQNAWGRTLAQETPILALDEPTVHLDLRHRIAMVDLLVDLSERDERTILSIFHELDLVREAANAAQLRRNMQGLDLVLVPEMIWDFCTPTVMVMERIRGAEMKVLKGQSHGFFWQAPEVTNEAILAWVKRHSG